MPTDALRTLRDVMFEAKSHGFDRLKDQQHQLGKAVREQLSAHGFASVAAPDFAAPPPPFPAWRPWLC